MYSLKCGMKPRHCDHLHICIMRLCHTGLLVIDGVSLTDCTNLEWLCHVGRIGTWYMLECSLFHSHNTQSWVCFHALLTTLSMVCVCLHLSKLAWLSVSVCHFQWQARYHWSPGQSWGRRCVYGRSHDTMMWWQTCDYCPGRLNMTAAVWWVT